jgi:hypothetical protein
VFLQVGLRQRRGPTFHQNGEQLKGFRREMNVDSVPQQLAGVQVQDEWSER